MLTIGTVVLGVADLRRAADFWMQALHYVPRADQDPDDPTWTVLVPAEGSGTPLALGLSETPVQAHPRPISNETDLDAYSLQRWIDERGKTRRATHPALRRAASGPHGDMLILLGHLIGPHHTPSVRCDHGLTQMPRSCS